MSQLNNNHRLKAVCLYALFLNIVNDCTICRIYLCHSLCIKHVHNNMRCLLKVLITLIRLEFLNNNNILLIYRCNEIFVLPDKKTSYSLKCILTLQNIRLLRSI